MSASLARRAARGSAAALLGLSILLLSGTALAQGSGEVGEPLPAYSARVLNARDDVSVGELKGTPVLLNKWATWCRPCVGEMPDLQNLYKDYKGRGFKIIGVSIDRPGGDQAVQEVARRRGVTYPIWRDEDDLFTSTFRSTGVPESILVDRDGIVVYRWRGVVGDTPATRRLIETAIASQDNYANAAADVTQEQAIGLGLAVAILAGLLSFLSPCVLPVVPSYVAFVTGVSGEQARATGRHLTLLNGLLFVAGFTSVFLILGASASAVGGALRDNSDLLACVGGVLLLLFGLLLIGILKVPGLERDARLLQRATRLKHRLGPASSYVVGAAFGAGWTPCIGPVLAAILTLAATEGTVRQGMSLLGAYSIGLAIPFLLATVALDRFILTSRRFRVMMPWVNRVSGVMLLLLGVVLISGAMTTFSQWFATFMPEGIG